MNFKPENLTVQDADLPALDDEATKEIKIIKDDAMNAFANAMFSIKEKFGDRQSDAREIVARMAETLDEYKGHGSLAVQQDDQQAGVLLRPMFPAAKAPDGKDPTILCIYRATLSSERDLQTTLNQFVGRSEVKIVQHATADVKKLVSVLDANAKKFEESLKSSAAWRSWFMQWADKCAKGVFAPPPLPLLLHAARANTCAVDRLCARLLLADACHLHLQSYIRTDSVLILPYSSNFECIRCHLKNGINRKLAPDMPSFSRRSKTTRSVPRLHTVLRNGKRLCGGDGSETKGHQRDVPPLRKGKCAQSLPTVRACLLLQS